MLSVEEIVDRKTRGIDCTEEESAEVKGWLKETIIQPNSADVALQEAIQIHFPIEYGEYLDETGQTE